MKRLPRIGLLPLYLELYDQILPEMRPKVESFLTAVAEELKAKDLDVFVAPVSRIDSEFRHAVDLFDEHHVDLIATLHLAYSPSLEAIGSLCSTSKPLLLLDTTPDYEFDQNVDADRIFFNHGIHGVQDLASVLRRRERPFKIVAGHLTESPMIERAAEIARAAYASVCLRGMKVLRLGETFVGMGDFTVDEGVLGRAFGISVEQIDVEDLSEVVESVTPEEIAAEEKADLMRFRSDISGEVHRRSLRVGLGLRAYLEQGEYGAFSMNFMSFQSKTGSVNAVPFLEASKAMERGIGYAGEGDVLTAALVGTLSCAFGKTTFTEMFCPDWKGHTLFLSHMGEINPEVSAEKPFLHEKPYPFSDAENPAIIACSPARGVATLVNLAPGPSDSFDLLLAKVEVLADTSKADLEKTIRCWIRPQGDVDDFLTDYSYAGGTHHSALVLGDHIEALSAFASYAGIGCVIIPKAR